MIVQDIKFYDISGVRTMISQTIVPSVETMRSREIEIQRDMNRLYEKKELDLLVVCFTSVLEDGSIFYAVGEKADKILDVYPDADGVPHSIQKGVFSRKTQIVPAVIEALE